MNAYIDGPWFVGMDGFSIGTSDWRNRDVIGIPIAEVSYRNTHEGKANAHLIAAAPELLEALETCLLIVEHLSKDAAPDTIDAARAAIAKARGEA